MKYKVEKILSDSKAMQRLNMVTAFAAIVLLAIVVRDMTQADAYVRDEDGRIRAIRWLKNGNNEYNLMLIVDADGERSEREVNIRRKVQSDEASAGGASEEELAVALREREISNLISEIELSKSRKTILPNRLSDGSRLSWEAIDKSKDDYLLIPFLYLILVLVIVWSSLSEPKDRMAELRADILSGLPRFSNQLLLMMNAGMILSDAFEVICHTYSMIPEDKRGFFEKSMIEIEERNRDHRSSTAQLLSEYAARHNVKEMMRIATILTENERRGSDVIESIERESSFLWENRKTRAAERGKALDAKMAYPLGLLLIILIVVTIAPAFLTM